MQLTDNDYSNLWLSILETQPDFAIEILDKPRGLFSLTKKSTNQKILILGANVSVNNSVAWSIARNKYLSHKIIEIALNGQLTRRYDVLPFNFDEEKLQQFFVDSGNKVVIKPLDMYQARGITFLPANMAAVQMAIAKVKAHSRGSHFLIEEYFAAKQEFKIIVSKQKILQVIYNFKGETHYFAIEEMHPDYHEIVLKIAQHSQLSYFGIDLMTTDITAKPTKKTAYINEINSNPGPFITKKADQVANNNYAGLKEIVHSWF